MYWCYSPHGARKQHDENIIAESSRFASWTRFWRCPGAGLPADCGREAVVERPEALLAHLPAAFSFVLLKNEEKESFKALSFETKLESFETNLEIE